MKASSLFALSLALLIGFGVAVAVKVTGILNPAPPPPKVEAPPSPPLPSILVAARNLHKGDFVGPDDIRIHSLTPSEFLDYQKRPTTYLPPLVGSAAFRQVRETIPAGHPFTTEVLEPIGKPDPLHAHLLPMTRAIDVAVVRDSSAAGLIQVGDWVDVYLTTDVGRSDEPMASPRTALLAQTVLVVAKRGTLYQTYAPLPSGPIHFTLAANSYRALLIDFARNKGSLSLMPVSLSEKKRLDKMKPEVEEAPDKVVSLSLPAGSPEAKAELLRVQAANHGEATVVGDEDLMRVFDLKPITPPAPTRPDPKSTVELYRGLKKQGTTTLTPKDDKITPVALDPTGTDGSAAVRAPVYTFRAPKPPVAPKTP